ncbi:MAG: hypothetical protein ACR2K0_06515 [Acidimicrobiales bacterium]
MTLLVVLAILVVLVGWGATVAISGKRRFARAGKIVPGVASNAPASWAGAHSREARLHRRLRDAVAAASANAALDTGGLADARVAIEVQALAIDDVLVVTSALAQPARGESLAKAEPAVEALEAVVAALVATTVAGTLAEVDRGLAEVGERVALLAAARAELEAETGDPGSP